MMSDDEDGGKKHFNLNEIMMERNKESGKKKRRKRKMTDKNVNKIITCKRKNRKINWIISRITVSMYFFALKVQ